MSILSPIISRDTFTKATSSADGRAIAGLFFFRALDLLFDLAYWLATDFFARPDVYTDVEDDVAESLTRLRFAYGTTVDLPNRDQREIVYSAVFGPWDASSPTASSSGFARLGEQLYQVSKPIVEISVSTGLPSLISRFRDKLVEVQSELQATKGTSLNTSEVKVLDPFAEQTAYKVVRSVKLGVIFRSGGVAATEFPYGADARREKFVAEACTELSAGKEKAASINRDDVVNLRTLATTGADAIAETIAAGSGPDDAEVLDLAQRWYRFGGAWTNVRGASKGSEIVVMQPVSTSSSSTSESSGLKRYRSPLA